MKQSSTTDLRRRSQQIYNAVEELGWAKITHRDRPDMVLVSHEQFSELMRKRSVRNVRNNQEAES